jgi:hypothetical protein
LDVAALLIWRVFFAPTVAPLAGIAEQKKPLLRVEKYLFTAAKNIAIDTRKCMYKNSYR